MELNKIYCMDCMEGMRQIPDDSIDLIVTDPPYYIEKLKKDQKENTIRTSSKNNIFYNEFDHFENLDSFKDFIDSVLIQFKRVLKPKAQAYIFVSYHHLDWMITKIKGLDFRYYKMLIWYKPDTMGVFPNQYGCNYESILWFRKKGDTGRVKLNIGNSQRDVWQVNSTNIKYRKECGYHPTPKPAKIIRQLIKNGSDEGDLILDPFMGSGTTAVCAKEINRAFMGFEKNPEYCEIARKRLSQQTLTFFGAEDKNEESNKGSIEGADEFIGDLCKVSGCEANVYKG